MTVADGGVKVFVNQSDFVTYKGERIDRTVLATFLRGRIKGLWIIGSNTTHSWINQNTCHDILGRLDFLVVQDMYHSTEMAQRADLLLPAAGWVEKEGTFINSERRISLIKKVAKAPGQALADFSIFRLVAYHLLRRSPLSTRTARDLCTTARLALPDRSALCLRVNPCCAGYEKDFGLLIPLSE